MLLSRVRGPTCYNDLRTHAGVVYNTYAETCSALGLLHDDGEWHETIKENAETAMPYQIRSLFVHIIVNYKVSDVYDLWITHWRSMSEDILVKRRNLTSTPNLELTDQELQNYTLAGNNTSVIFLISDISLCNTILVVFFYKYLSNFIYFYLQRSNMC